MEIPDEFLAVGFIIREVVESPIVAFNFPYCSADRSLLRSTNYQPNPSI
tara:strand:+ start:214 stop:360 length:147 start_codon:yes stop_codon:yes gene_type:complete